MATKFITVSIDIMHDQNLSHSQKFILAEIEQLTSLEKGCIASNSHFAELIGINRGSVSKAIKGLEEMGYISSEIKIGSRNRVRTLVILGDSSGKRGDSSGKRGDSSGKRGDSSGIESKENITNNTTRIKQLDEKVPGYEGLNSHQKIQLLQSKLTKHINLNKLKIFRDDLLAAKELVEQIKDPEDFISAYLEHKKTLTDKKYLKGMFAFMAGYVDGSFKSAKEIEDDYVITIHDEWTKLDDGNYAMLNGHVIDPMTGDIIPGYWDKKV